MGHRKILMPVIQVCGIYRVARFVVTFSVKTISNIASMVFRLSTLHDANVWIFASSIYEQQQLHLGRSPVRKHSNASNGIQNQCHVTTAWPHLHLCQCIILPTDVCTYAVHPVG